METGTWNLGFGTWYLVIGIWNMDISAFTLNPTPDETISLLL